MSTWLLVALAMVVIVVLFNLPEGRKPDDDDVDRLVDGADAARFLGAIKARLEEAAFEAELGL